MSGNKMPDEMIFFMIVNDPDIARYASKNGVSRLFVDLEYMGKDIRQKDINSWKSDQTAKDVTRIREAADNAHLLVRINPLHDGTKAELDDVLARGADSVMLPMFHSYDDLARFYDMIGDRAEAVPLVETVSALELVPEFCAKLPISRLHFGLNDLHLELKFDFMFELLSDQRLEEAAQALRHHQISFGIGGIARAGEGIVSPEYILGEHVRLGSDAAILSRTLHRNAPDLKSLKAEMDLPQELSKLQAIYRNYCQADKALLERNQTETADRIRDVVTLIQKKKAL